MLSVSTVLRFPEGCPPQDGARRLVETSADAQVSCQFSQFSNQTINLVFNGKSSMTRALILLAAPQVTIFQRDSRRKQLWRILLC
jgi:hypothetical protein